MGMGMKSLKWEGIGTKNLFPHTSSVDACTVLEIRVQTETHREIHSSQHSRCPIRGGVECFSSIRYYTIRDAIMTCAQKPTSQFNLPRGTKKIKSGETEELKTKNGVRA